MQYIGVDIREIARIEKVIARWGQSFMQRIYTDPELSLCRQKAPSLAARFAGKEAVIKALGTQNSGISWKEIEILSEPGGKPSVHLHGRAQNRANSLGLDNLAISLSHSREYAVACIVGEAK